MRITHLTGDSTNLYLDVDVAGVGYHIVRDGRGHTECFNNLTFRKVRRDAALHHVLADFAARVARGEVKYTNSTGA